MSTLNTAVNDRVPVGSPQILDSDHVSEGPGRIAKAPVPSVYVDDRGDIHRLRVGGKRLNLLYSKQGVMRSGYLHPHSVYDTVISGRVEVWELTATGTKKSVYEKDDSFEIRPYVPHILHFLKDSILVEWWTVADFRCYYYHPYRKIIDVQNSIISKDNSDYHLGKHQRLIPQDDLHVTKSVSSTGWMLLVSLSSGLLGFGLGWFLSTKPNK